MLNVLLPPEKPPVGAMPASTAPGSPKPSEPIPTGVVSQDDALKGAAHADIKTFSLTDASGKPIAPGAPGAGTGSSVPLGSLVQGKHAVELMDALVPALLVVMFKYMKVDVRKAEMQLTEKEKNVLAPIVEACMNSIVLNFNSPWTTLAISVGVIYGGKIIEHGGVKFLDKKASEVKTPKDITNEVIQKSNERMGMKKENAQAVQTAVQEQVRSAPLGHWTEDDVRKVEKKRKKGPKEAIKWLEKNWERIGGQI